MNYLKSKNRQTFVTETLKVGIIKFQGFRVLVTSYFHHFAEVHVMRQEVSKFNSLKSKNPQTHDTETFEAGIIIISRVLHFDHIYCIKNAFFH